MNRATMTLTADGEARKLDAHALLEARREVYVLRGRRVVTRETAGSSTDL